MGDDIEMSKRVLSRVCNAFNCLENGTEKISWFFTFGTMLEYVADRTFGLKFDIDIGVFLDECDPQRLIQAMDSFGYKFSRQFLNDQTGQPLNMHFKPDNGQIKGTPEIDVYMFFKHGKHLLYTYDINDERREIPRNGYTFKKIAHDLICPVKADVERYKEKVRREPNIVSDRGIWKYWIYENHGSYTVRIPWAYGTLCDQWYPGWAFRSLVRGKKSQSESPDGLLKVKSCKEL